MRAAASAARKATTATAHRRPAPTSATTTPPTPTAHGDAALPIRRLVGEEDGVHHGVVLDALLYRAVQRDTAAGVHPVGEQDECLAPLRVVQHLICGDIDRVVKAGGPAVVPVLLSSPTPAPPTATRIRVLRLLHLFERSVELLARGGEVLQELEI